MTDMNSGNTANPWMAIAMVVANSTTADILTAKAMKQIGDLGELRRQRGLPFVIKRLATNLSLIAGVTFMAISFYSLLAALHSSDLSLVAPASASLTFVSNAVGAKFILHENVDRRRWTCAILVCAGVALLRG